MGAFHAYDIRGVYNKDFDKEVAYKVGYFLPELLNTDTILVGYDVRVSSPEIREYLLKGITDAGANVKDMGLATTPMVYFVTANYGYKASVQITASHNSKEYNGLKVSRDNALPVGYDNGLGTIEKWIKEGRECKAADIKGSVESVDYKDEYIKFQLKYKGDYSNLNIGIDISNGMAGLIIKDIIGEGSSSLHYIFDDLDGTFPNHEANPLVAENIVDLQNLVREKGCDVGVIFDGDADRVMFVDENSKFISPDLMIALMGHYWLEQRGLKGKVIQDIRSSKAVGEYLAPLGGEMYTWRVGRAFAAHKLREIDGLFGGELAGHYYFKEFFYSDSGIMAALIILDIVAELKKEGVKLSEAIAKIVKYKNSGEVNFKLERKKEAVEAIKEYFMLENPTKVMDFDGYRLEYPEWWFNVRLSNTEPYLRVIVEAKTDELLESKLSKIKEIIKKFSI